MFASCRFCSVSAGMISSSFSIWLAGIVSATVCLLLFRTCTLRNWASDEKGCGLCSYLGRGYAMACPIVCCDSASSSSSHQGRFILSVLS